MTAVEPAAPLAVRAASPADVPALAALINAAFAIEHEWVDGDRTSIDEVAGLLRQGTFLVAESENGAPIACAYLEQKGYRCYLGMLAVEPSRKGGGLGTRMMAAAEDYCRGRRVRVMDIRILSVRRELPPFYRRLGYVDEGTAPYENRHAKVPAHFIRMTKNL